MTFLSLFQNTILKPHNDRHVYHTINFVPTQCLSSPYPKGSGGESENVSWRFLGFSCFGDQFVSGVSLVFGFPEFLGVSGFIGYWCSRGFTGFLETLSFVKSKKAFSHQRSI